MKRKHNTNLLGRFIITDPEICDGQPTFRGTRIMVWQVLDMLSKGKAWETIVEECHHSVTKEAIAEAITLSGQAFMKHADEFIIKQTAA